MTDLRRDDRERAMLRMNDKNQTASGRDTVLGFSETTERRLYAGARLVYWLIGAVVMATSVTLGAYYRADGRITQAETTAQQHSADIRRLDAEKQSKEAADGNQKLILDKLEAMERNFKDLREDVKEIRDRVDRHR